jgi:hypothetical protein
MRMEIDLAIHHQVMREGAVPLAPAMRAHSAVAKLYDDERTGRCGVVDHCFVSRRNLHIASLTFRDGHRDSSCDYVQANERFATFESKRRKSESKKALPLMIRTGTI